jgi:hypothetical protein
MTISMSVANRLRDRPVDAPFLLMDAHDEWIQIAELDASDPAVRSLADCARFVTAGAPRPRRAGE